MRLANALRALQVDDPHWVQMSLRAFKPLQSASTGSCFTENAYIAYDRQAA